MTAMNGIKPGTEVRFFARNPYRRDPADGTPATVTKVGRRYATAEYAVTMTFRDGELPDKRTIEFDMATGDERGSKGFYGPQVRTLEQVALDLREDAARKVLFGAGISIDGHQHLTLEQIEALAEVAGTFPVLDRS